MAGHGDIGILKQREDTRRKYYDGIKRAALAVDPDLLLHMLREGNRECGPVPDIEYSKLGNDQYSFFYNLMDSFYTQVCAARGDKEIIGRLVARFRECSALLLEYDLLPDMKTMTTWDAITTGTLRNPFLLKAYNPNQSEAHITDKKNITNIFNMKYPQYMPYLEYSPEQRLMFDEFVFLTKTLEEDQRKESRLKDISGAYGFEDIKRQANELCDKTDESEIIEKAEIDEMNVRLAEVFDYLLKSAHAIMKQEANIYNQFDEDADKQKQYILSNRVNNVTTHVLEEQGAWELSKRAYKTFNKDIMCKCLLNKITPEMAQTAIRIGAALFSPAAMVRANISRDDWGILTNSFSFDELLKMTEEYYEYKKSLFVPGVKPMRLKKLDEIAKIPLPQYLGMLRGQPDSYVKNPHGQDIEHRYTDLYEYGFDKFSLWSDNTDICNPFYWLNAFADFLREDKYNLSLKEIKKIVGLPDTEDNYREEAIASVKEEYYVPDNYGEKDPEM